MSRQRQSKTIQLPSSFCQIHFGLDSSGRGGGGEGKQAIFCLHKVGIWPRMPWVSAGNIHDCETDDSYMQQNRIAKENSSNRNCITYSKAVRNSLFTTVLADPYRFELKGNHTVRKSEIKPDAI